MRCGVMEVIVAGFRNGSRAGEQNGGEAESGRAAPQDIAEKLAELKALRVSYRHPEAMVVGASGTRWPTGSRSEKRALVIVRSPSSRSQGVSA